MTLIEIKTSLPSDPFQDSASVSCDRQSAPAQEQLPWQDVPPAAPPVHVSIQQNSHRSSRASRGPTFQPHPTPISSHRVPSHLIVSSPPKSQTITSPSRSAWPAAPQPARPLFLFPLFSIYTRIFSILGFIGCRVVPWWSRLVWGGE